MASATGDQILARSRIIATQVGGDANQSAVIDARGGLRALLNDTIRILYRRRANSQDFTRDIVVRHTITMAGGIGTCPDTVMRELLAQAQFQDENGSLITYYNYNIDADSGQNFQQLGYVVMNGDTFVYTAPNSVAYDGDMYVTAATFPTFPASMSQSITFPSQGIIDDLCSLLAQAIVGKFELAV